MRSYAAALWMEFLKVKRSKVTWITMIVASFVPLVGGLFMLILKDPEKARQLGIISAKAQLLGGTADWPSYAGLLAQILAIAGLLVFGFIAAWLFGREYSDRTMKDLLALPTSRLAIVSAKFTVVTAWCAVLAIWVYVFGLGIGAIVNIPGWSRELALQTAGHLAAIAGLTIVIITPVCFAANAGRGYLAPLGCLILLLVTAQLLAALGWADYFPWAVPGLLSQGTAQEPISLSAWSYAAVALAGAAGLAGTFAWWQFTDQTS